MVRIIDGEIVQDNDPRLRKPQSSSNRQHQQPTTGGPSAPAAAISSSGIISRLFVTNNTI